MGKPIKLATKLSEPKQLTEAEMLEAQVDYAALHEKLDRDMRELEASRDQISFQAGVREGVSLERARVVRWLREGCKSADLIDQEFADATMAECAHASEVLGDAIERGEHEEKS